MDPLEFQRLAERLAANPNAAELRTAISRAYYAAFHSACPFLTDAGFTPPRTATAHDEVQKRLNNCGQKEVQSAAAQLGQ
jgi:uncharacterized protein (UPF0332 family)